jgi:Bacterial Ig-like domain (group 3)
MLHSHRLRFTPLRIALPVAAILTLLSVFLAPAAVTAQTPRHTPVLTLLPSGSPATRPTETKSLAPDSDPANHHAFGTLQNGQTSAPEELTLGFTQLTTILSLKSTPDFTIEEGGTCAEGNHYGPDNPCTIRVRFTPKGPGQRTGKLTVEHSAAASPESISFGGQYLAPAVSFVPSVINYVPATYNATTKSGILADPINLAIDGADSLYIDDVGLSAGTPNRIDVIDSSGILNLYAGGGTDYPGDGEQALQVKLDYPISIAPDSFGNLYIGDYDAGTLQIVDINRYINTVVGPGGTCTTLPCVATQYSAKGVSSVAVDPQNEVFLLNDFTAQVLQFAPPDIFLYGGDPNLHDFVSALAFDHNGTLFYAAGSFCEIRTIDPASRQTSVVAGTGYCGVTGDGGPARSAELGDIEQIAIDAANNLYLVDAVNNVVRRIDAATGFIHTVAGVAGKLTSTGNGGPATAATFADPLGVAVDSNGNIYVTESLSRLTGDVRKIGPNGDLVFSSPLAAPSAAQTITVSNVGNAPLSITQLNWSGNNAADFTTDAHTTTCPFIPSGAGSLAVGQTCTIGIIFKPSLIAAESATLNFTDNTNLGVNTIQLNGTGNKQPTLVTWPTPAAITTTTALSATQLNATATYNGVTVPGTFVYTPALGAVLTAGTQTLKTTFTPTNTTQFTTYTAVVYIVVNKVTPTITWSAPASITTAVALSTTQLNATAVVNGTTIPGTFVYTPAAGAKLAAGTQTLKATFTPTNAAVYNTATASVSIVVTAAGTVKPAVALKSSQNPITTFSPITFSVTLTATNGKVPTGSVDLMNGAAKLGSATLSSTGTASLTVKSMPVGAYSITAVYNGDPNFSPSTSPAIQQKVTSISVFRGSGNLPPTDSHLFQWDPSK